MNLKGNIKLISCLTSINIINNRINKGEKVNLRLDHGWRGFNTNNRVLNC